MGQKSLARIEAGMTHTIETHELKSADGYVSYTMHCSCGWAAGADSAKECREKRHEHLDVKLVAEYGPGTMSFAHPHGPAIERPVKYFRQYSDNTIEWEFADDAR